MKISYTTSQIEFHEKYMDDFLNADEEGMKIAVMDRTEALYGGDWTIDKEWCDKNGVPYSQGKLIQNTGCIIAVKGNILLDVKKKFTGGECLCDIFELYDFCHITYLYGMLYKKTIGKVKYKLFISSYRKKL